MSYLFYDRGYWHNGQHTGKYSNFNEDLSSWDVNRVTNMNSMFLYCGQFNSDLSNWNVSGVTTMKSMFGYTKFNRGLTSWNTSNVNNMEQMFHNATLFNQDLSDWDVRKVTSMNQMFVNATLFNQDLNEWDVSNVKDMNYMFGNTTMNQELCWDLSGKNSQQMMDGSSGTISKSYRYCRYQMIILEIESQESNTGTLESVVSNIMKSGKERKESRNSVYLVVSGCLMLTAGLYMSRHGWMGQYDEEDYGWYDKYDTPV